MQRSRRVRGNTRPIRCGWCFPNGGRLLLAMAGRGLDETELAEAAELERRVVAFATAGKPTGLREAIAMARVLGVPPVELLDRASFWPCALLMPQSVSFFSYQARMYSVENHVSFSTVLL